MTIRELIKKHSETMIQSREQCVIAIEEELKNAGLGGLVKRKRDGRLGWIEVKRRLYSVGLEFYPKTKSGEKSQRCDGYVSSLMDISEQFEPAEEE